MPAATPTSGAMRRAFALDAPASLAAGFAPPPGPGGRLLPPPGGVEAMPEAPPALLPRLMLSLPAAAPNAACAELVVIRLPACGRGAVGRQCDAPKGTKAASNTASRVLWRAEPVQKGLLESHVWLTSVQAAAAPLPLRMRCCAWLSCVPSNAAARLS